MTNKMNRPNVLHTCLGKSQRLTDLVEYTEAAIVSKTILDKPVGSITLFAFDKDQKLSEHTTPYDAVVQIIDGRARLTVGGEDVEVSSGQITIMPGNLPHVVVAEEKFKMLLTMIRA